MSCSGRSPDQVRKLHCWSDDHQPGLFSPETARVFAANLSAFFRRYYGRSVRQLLRHRGPMEPRIRLVTGDVEIRPPYQVSTNRSRHLSSNGVKMLGTVGDFLLRFRMVGNPLPIFLASDHSQARQAVTCTVPHPNAKAFDLV